METYGETRKCKERKLRWTSFDMMSFLREKMDRDSEMKREELEVRKRDRQAKKKERLDILRQNQALQT